jgi:hypothetical protein
MAKTVWNISPIEQNSIKNWWIKLEMGWWTTTGVREGEGNAVEEKARLSYPDFSILFYINLLVT